MNAFEQLGRESKAQKIARAIWAQMPPELRVHSDLAATYAKATEAERIGWADVAGVNEPSDKTWSRVVELLAEKIADERRYLSMLDDHRAVS